MSLIKSVYTYVVGELDESMFYFQKFEERGKRGEEIISKKNTSLVARVVALNDTDIVLYTYWTNGKLSGEVNLKNGLKDGACKAWLKDGTLFKEINYKEGKLHGWFGEYSTEGKLIEEGVATMGKFDGEYKKYRTNGAFDLIDKYCMGDLLETKKFWENGNIGIHTVFTKNEPIFQNTWQSSKSGKLYLHAQYDSDKKPISLVYFYENGNKEYDLHFKKGLLNGVNIAYYENGEIRIKELYIGGKLHGPSRGYYDNGTLMVLETYRSDKLDGVFESYNKDGSLFATGTFSKGKVNSMCKYDKKGKQVNVLETITSKIFIVPCATPPHLKNVASKCRIIPGNDNLIEDYDFEVHE